MLANADASIYLLGERHGLNLAEGDSASGRGRDGILLGTLHRTHKVEVTSRSYVEHFLPVLLWSKQ